MTSSDDLRLNEPALFGPFCLTASARLLTKGNKPVAIGSRALELLIGLVERAGEVVSTRDLIKRVWPEVVVEEANLRAQIGKLRKALDDGQAGARYIVNFPGRGYSFVGQVQRAAREQGSPPIAIPAKRVEPEKPPPRLPRMFGRDETVSALSALIGLHRFVTVVGPGGIGKTTVAVSVAHALLSNFPDAVCFVDLGALTEAALVPTAVGSALGYPPQGQDPLGGLLAFLAGRRILLILDSCEHVIESVAPLTERLFRDAPQVHVLATSREALRVEGEHVYLLMPLDAPPDSQTMTAAQALSSPAVQVFMERAAASGHQLGLIDAEARIVADICRRLDGIPLAIEIAASRAGAYGIKGTADLLDHLGRLLWQGQRTAIPRHRTLQAMLDWSYELLSDVERRVLCRLAIFVGNFTLEAAQSIAGEPTFKRLIVADVVTSLVDKSLIWISPIHGFRYRRLPDATRTYASAKLTESGEYDAVARRHALYFSQKLELDMIEGLAFSGGNLTTYAPHLGNVRAALEWSFSERGDSALGIELAGQSAQLFLGLSLLRECQRWCERGLDALEKRGQGTKGELVLQKALAISAMFALGNSKRVRAAIERGSALAEVLGDRQQQLHLLSGLNIFLCRDGNYRGALAVAERGASIAEEVGSPAGVLMAESMLGVGCHLVGNQNAAQRHCELGLKLAASSGADRVDYFGYDHYVRGLVVLARTMWLTGSPDRALRLVQQAIDEAQMRERPVTLCIALIYGVPVFFWTENLERADEHIEWLISHAARYSLAPFKAVGLASKGQLLIARGQPRPGVELLRDALSTLQTERFHLLTSAFYSALAEGLAHIGEREDAKGIIAGAISRAEEQSGTFDLPDLLRVQGEILASSHPPDFAAAEESLLSSLDWARRQAAVSWEKRAAAALVQLRERHGKPEDTQRLLTDIGE